MSQRVDVVHGEVRPRKDRDPFPGLRFEVGLSHAILVTEPPVEFVQVLGQIGVCVDDGHAVLVQRRYEGRSRLRPCRRAVLDDGGVLANCVASASAARSDAILTVSRFGHSEPATRQHHGSILSPFRAAGRLDDRRALEMAAQQNRSLSTVIAGLATRGLAQLEAPVVLSTDKRTGLPVLSIGRPLNSHDVAAALDDE